MSQTNNLTRIIYGILLVFVMHIVAVIAIFWMALILQFALKDFYIALRLLIYAGLGFPFAQFIYVIPVLLKLKQQQRWEMMKGVIIGAGLTVLLSGGCWLLFSGAVPW